MFTHVYEAVYQCIHKRDLRCSDTFDTYCLCITMLRCLCVCVCVCACVRVCVCARACVCRYILYCLGQLLICVLCVRIFAHCRRCPHTHNYAVLARGYLKGLSQGHVVPLWFCSLQLKYFNSRCCGTQSATSKLEFWIPKTTLKSQVPLIN